MSIALVLRHCVFLVLCSTFVEGCFRTAGNSGGSNDGGSGSGGGGGEIPVERKEF